MSADREGNFHGLDKGGERGAGGSDSQRRHLEYAYQQVGQESAWDVLFRCFGHSEDPEWGMRGRILGGYLPSAAALLVCMTAGREGECATYFFFLLFRRSMLTGWVDGGGMVTAAFYSQRWSF